MQNNEISLFSVRNSISYTETIPITKVEDKVDIFTQSTIRELINDKVNNGRQFVLTVVEDLSKKDFCFSGEGFFKYLSTKKDEKNPLSREKMDIARFYELEGESFYFFASLKMNQDSEGNETNIKKAIEYLVKSNEEVTPEEQVYRQLWLGLQYEKAKNIPKAISYYKRAGNEDVSSTCLEAVIQSIRQLVRLKTDHNEVTDLLLKLERLQPLDKDVLFALGTRFEKGLGLEADQQKALSYYHQAASQDHLLAICKMVIQDETQNHQEGGSKWREKLPQSLKNCSNVSLLEEAVKLIQRPKRSS